MHTHSSAVRGAARPTTTEAHQERQERTTARFMAMAQAAMAGRSGQNAASPTPPAEPVPDLLRPRTVQELTAERRAHREQGHTKHEQARREAAPTSPLPSLTAPLQEAVERQLTQMQADTLPPLEELVDLEALRPKRGRGAGTEGAGELVRMVYELAKLRLKAARYRFTPSQVVIHTSQELLAGACGKDETTIYRWTEKLKATGVLDARPHYTTMTTKEGKQVTVVDGMLFALRLKPGHKARLRFEDLVHQYRDLDLDRKLNRTAWQVVKGKRAVQKAVRQAKRDGDQDAVEKLQGSLTHENRSVYITALRQWAVSPEKPITPLGSDPCNFPPGAPRSVQDVIHALPLVFDAHLDKRNALVGLLASGLAHALSDPQSHRWYCRIIWDAYAASVEGRSGLQVLAAQLARLDTDRREWEGLRNPAALLVARMRAAPLPA